MAYQHFYSRVPARVSMYNKFDGFDTFAHSQGLTREFVERELSIVYQDKLSKTDMPLVRKGEINPVYYQCCVKSGKLVQGCITYLPLDYTGERSSYFTHSLVFTDEEAKLLLTNVDNTIFNSDVFKKDISEFNITSNQASPNNNYPELNYVTNPMTEVQGIYKKYNPETVKNFIGAILLSLCKKGKYIYFKLVADDKDLSSEAIKFINEITSIFPYTLKQNLSFITYLNDFTQYPSFKLKCVSSKCPEIPQEKGIFFDFKIDLVTGLNLEEVRINKNLINFLYSLLEHNEMRVEFLKFITNAIDKIPTLQNLNIKILSDLVFLFCGSSGLFVEENIISNDEGVLDFFNIYEKYRAILSEEYRVRVYKVLNRYPLNHLAIPKLIFAKVSKLYPLEILSAKKEAMDVVLELIHTDIMREKLFAFISNNYSSEDDETKKTINFDLCRVFYGGFMQPQILKFFLNNFDNEPEDTQNQILEKLLLTIRTISIQQKVLEFIDIHYNIFTIDQKHSFYNTFFEMLPECDDLAVALIKIVNKYGSNEDEQFKDYIQEQLGKLLEVDYRKKENLLLPILINEEGLCADIVIKLIFTNWYQRKIYTQFIDILKDKKAISKTNLIIQIFNLVPNMDKIAEEKLLNSLKGIYLNDYFDTSLYVWIDLYKTLESVLLTNRVSVIKYIKDEEIIKAIINSVNDVFDIKMNINGIEILRDFAKENRKVRESNNYQYIASYVDMIGDIQINEFNKAINIYDALPKDKQLRIKMANHISACVVDRKKQTLLETLYFDLLVSHLLEEKIYLDKLFIQYKEVYKRQYYATHGAKANPTKALGEASGNAMKLIFDCCYTICKASNQLNEVICNSDSKLRLCVQDFVSNYGSRAKKWINNVMSNLEITQFTNYFNKVVKECKPRSGKLFTKIFLKK